MIAIPEIRLASLQLSLGIIKDSKPKSRAMRAIGKTPVTGRSDPSNASSPTSNLPLGSKNICPELSNIEIAMGKSKCVPFLGTSAGARLMDTRERGNIELEFLIADFTLTLASWTAVSGKPTITIAGRPEETSTSTSTKEADNPTTVPEYIL